MQNPEKENDSKIREEIYDYLKENGWNYTEKQRRKLRSFLRKLTVEYREDLEWLENRNNKLQKEVIWLRKKEAGND